MAAPRKISELPESIGEQIRDDILLTGVDIAELLDENKNRKLTRANLLYGRAGWAIPSAALGLKGDGVTDDSKKLQQAIEAINNLGYNQNRKITFLLATQGLGFRIDNTVDLFSNMDLIIKADIILGARGRFRIFGEIFETPPSGFPVLRANALSGSTTLYISNLTLVQNFFQVGNKITLRGENDANNKAFQRHEAFVTAINTAPIVDNPGLGTYSGNSITITPALDEDFLAVYPGSAYTQETGDIDESNIRIQIFSGFTADIAAGSIFLPVVNASIFQVGDIIELSDAENTTQLVNPIAGSTSNNNVHVETNRIVAINLTTNTITLAFSCAHSYKFAAPFYGGISRVDARVNSSIVGAKCKLAVEQVSRNIYTFTIANAFNCEVRDCEVNDKGAVSWKAIAFRLDSGLNNRVINCSAIRPGFVAGGEGYGFAIYRGTHCTIKDCYGEGNRHTVLLFAGAAYSRVINVISVDCQISDFDTHGADVQHAEFHDCVAVGGVRLSADASHRTAYKVGNPFHMFGDFNIRFFNCTAINYRGAAFETLPRSSDIEFYNCKAINCDEGIRLNELGRNNTLISSRVLYENCLFKNIAIQICLINGGTNKIAQKLILRNCISYGNARHWEIDNAQDVLIESCLVIEPKPNPSLPHTISLNGITDAKAIRNVILKAERGVRLENCPGALIIENTFVDLIQGIALRLEAGNTGYRWQGNRQYGGVAGVNPYNGVANSVGLLVPSGDLITTKLDSANTFPFTSSTAATAIPLTNATPTTAQGEEILNRSYTPAYIRSRIQVTLYIPYVSVSAAENVVCALFVGTTCIGAGVIRLPTAGATAGSNLVIFGELFSSDNVAKTISARISTRAPATVTLTLGDRFQSLGIPYIVINETPTAA